MSIDRSLRIALFSGLVLGTCAGVYALGHWILGMPGLDPQGVFPLHRELRMSAVLVALLIFTYAANDSEAQASNRDLETLAPFLELDADALEAMRRRIFASATADRIGALIGALIGVAVDVGADLAAGTPPIEHSGDAVQLVLMMALFALLAGRATATIDTGRFFSRLGRDHTRIELFVPEPLRVYGRRGLRLSLNWFIGSAIASLLVLDATVPWLVATIVATTLALGAVTLVLPSRGIHAALQRAKREELARVRERIRDGGAALLAGRGDTELAALIAYEGRVEAVREWPIDTPMLLRFAALAALATGSWLGGAVVERILSAWLG